MTSKASNKVSLNVSFIFSVLCSIAHLSTALLRLAIFVYYRVRNYRKLAWSERKKIVESQIKFVRSFPQIL